jgi:hypothetical protein
MKKALIALGTVVIILIALIGGLVVAEQRAKVALESDVADYLERLRNHPRRDRRPRPSLPALCGTAHRRPQLRRPRAREGNEQGPGPRPPPRRRPRRPAHPLHHRRLPVRSGQPGEESGWLVHRGGHHRRRRGDLLRPHRQRRHPHRPRRRPAPASRCSRTDGSTAAWLCPGPPRCGPSARATTVSSSRSNTQTRTAADPHPG